VSAFQRVDDEKLTLTVLAEVKWENEHGYFNDHDAGNKTYH
jgi:hypothetical protein